MTEQEKILSNIQLKSIEKECLDRVFNKLCKLQDEFSSDQDSIKKTYLNEIEKKASMKKMKLNLNLNSFKNKTLKKEKKYKEDDKKFNSLSSKNNLDEDEKKKKIGIKSIRKMLKILNQEISAEEIELMIWVNKYFF